MPYESYILKASDWPVAWAGWTAGGGASRTNENARFDGNGASTTNQNARFTITGNKQHQPESEQVITDHRGVYGQAKLRPSLQS